MNTIAKFENKTQENIEYKPLNLHQKLVSLRKSVPNYLKKDAKNAHFKYSYVKESTVLDLISEPMNDLGLLLTQEMVEMWSIGNGVRAKLVYTWTDSANPADKLELTQMIQDEKSDVKTCGGLLTYSMRYFLLKFLNIATDDDDPDKFQPKNDLKDASPISPSQVQTLKALIKTSGVKESGFLSWAKCVDIDSLPRHMFESSIDLLGKRLPLEG